MARILLLLAVALAEDGCAKDGCPKVKDHWLLQKKFTQSKFSEKTERKSFTHQNSCAKEFVTLGRHGAEDMTECQGDCDRDSDCAPGLKCKQRRWNEAVPGCHGGEVYPVVDYCYNPTCEGLPELDSSFGSHGSVNMPECSGDCDSDEDCAEGLRCFQRDGVEQVPGCLGLGVEGFDYCYDPTHEIGSTTFSSFPSTSVSTSEPSSSAPGPSTCLCVFDIDRTLTGKQGTAGNACPQNYEVSSITDYAYGPGPLTISDAGQNLQNTFCNQCHLGVVSAGSASGSDEKNFLLEHVLKSISYSQLRSQDTDATVWSYRTVNSPLVLLWEDKKKQDAVEGILSWYAQRGIAIPASKVFFFGDRTENIGPFASKGFNAREISCASRDTSKGGIVGYCGGTAAEIVETSGIQLCNAMQRPPWDQPVPDRPPVPAPPSNCLCVFDIDRTLTGKQGISGRWSACPANKKIDHIWDKAYSGGWLTLSEAGQNLEKTFCNSCYLGVVSAGSASGDGSAERRYLLKHVLKSEPFTKLQQREPQASSWSRRRRQVKSPLVLKWPDRLKQDAVQDIVTWYKKKGIKFAPERVHFFGDRTENIGPFRSSGFNSREISCATRDYGHGNGMVGLCGAELHEIVETPGVATCN